MKRTNPGWAKAIGALLVMTAAALGCRAHLIGNPLAGVDEQFYLLVGDRMWHGAVPFVDIWDRKPFGLFLVYAAIRALPGDGVLAYQLVATACLALTGAVVAAVARRATDDAAAIAAGLATIGFSTLLGVGLGEAPVFYDLLLALAAWLVLRAGDGAASDRNAVVAMLLAGAAITIKTTAVFEGVAFGLVLIAQTGRRHGWGWPLTRRAAIWAAIGIAPSAGIALYYLALGRFDAFWFANVGSILRREGGTDPGSLVQFVASLLVVSPLALPAMLALRDRRAPDDRRLLGAWALAAALGFVAIGYFAFHYALPLVAPLAILAARGLPAAGERAALALIGLGLVWIGAIPPTRDRDEADLARLAAALPAAVRTDCLLVREGPAILYLRSRACLAGPYAFPGHFTAPGDAKALGRPRAEIVADALARRPAAIVDVPAPPTWQPAAMSPRRRSRSASMAPRG